MKKEYLDRMKNLLGKDYELYLKAMEENPKKGIRCLIDNNIEKTKLPYGINEYMLDTNEKLGNSPIHHLGGIYIQEPSAMAPVNLIDFKDDYLVLDLCASPGGKSGQIAERIPNGILVSNEIDKKRSQILFSNIERMGYKNVIVLNEEPKNLVNNFKGLFDVILVDAPCSGEGMMRKDEYAQEMWNISNISLCESRDKQILDVAHKMLKKGGFLIYSTCTFAVEEDENMVKYLIDKYNYKTVKPNDSLLSSGVKGLIENSIRFYPHNSLGEGQFMCALEKTVDEEIEQKKFKCNKLESKELKLVNEFINEYTFGLNLNLIKRGNTIFHLVSDLNLNGLNVLSYGVRIGEIENRFIPNHHFFKVYGKNFKNIVKLDINDNRVLKYLRGEEIEAEGVKGYGAIMISNLILGGFKASNGTLKNLYPKGLRNS